MLQKLIYVELKSGYNDDGPAWIGNASFSKSGHTIYFNGLILKGSGKGTCHDLETNNTYWVSGIKKNGQNRHWAGHGLTIIDETVVNEYLAMTGISKLPKNGFIVTQLDNNPKIEKANKLENRLLS